jgi:tetrapyrrole methylase family protein/MazG family protein
VTDYGKRFDLFVDIVRQLRSASGCPWDREQSPATLKRYLLEETQELLEAIEANDPHHTKEESGDLLYLIILLAQIHMENGHYDIGDVLDTVTAKMIRRHPHVFADEKIGSVAELRQKWLEIKKGEKSAVNKSEKN